GITTNAAANTARNSSTYIPSTPVPIVPRVAALYTARSPGCARNLRVSHSRFGMISHALIAATAVAAIHSSRRFDIATAISQIEEQNTPNAAVPIAAASAPLSVGTSRHG